MVCQVAFWQVGFLAGWQDGDLDRGGAKAVESLQVVATGRDLAQPDNISSHPNSTVEHRFRKAVPESRKSRRDKDLRPALPGPSAPFQRAAQEGRKRPKMPRELAQAAASHDPPEGSRPASSRWYRPHAGGRERAIPSKKGKRKSNKAFSLRLTL